MRPVLFILLAIVMLPSQSVFAAKESGSAKVVKKLQMMVQEATAERDRVAAESAKLAAELEQLKKDLEKEKKAKTDVEKEFDKKEQKLKGDIAEQKSQIEEIVGRLDKTTAKLHEVIDKYNALNQSKNELAAEHVNLQNTQQFTASELKACEGKNVKMYEGAKLVIAGYQRCQNKGMFDNFVDGEPATQINNVGFEKIVQEYEDKIIKQKFHPSPKPSANPAPADTMPEAKQQPAK